MIRDERVRLAVIVTALAFLVACATEAPPPPPPPEKPPAATAQLFDEQARRGATKEGPNWSRLPDFDELRTSFGDREDFADRCERGRPARDVFAAIEQEDWSGVESLAIPWLEACPVDIDIHIAQAVALDELGREEESGHHLLWHKGLVDSILRSGDGRTPETAWVVISIAEEYSILHVFGMSLRGRDLLEGEIDRMEVESEGKVYVVHFDSSAHFRRLRSSLGESG